MMHCSWFVTCKRHNTSVTTGQLVQDHSLQKSVSDSIYAYTQINYVIYFSDGCAAVTITRVRKYPFSLCISVPRRQCPRCRLRRPFRRHRPFRHLRLQGKAPQKSKHITLCHMRRNTLLLYTRFRFRCVLPRQCFSYSLCMYCCYCIIVLSCTLSLSHHNRPYPYVPHVQCTRITYRQIYTSTYSLYNIQSDPFNLLGIYLLENNVFYTLFII